MYSTCEAYPQCLSKTYEWQVNEVSLMGTADLYKYFGVLHGYFQSASQIPWVYALLVLNTHMR